MYHFIRGRRRLPRQPTDDRIGFGILVIAAGLSVFHPFVGLSILALLCVDFLLPKAWKARYALWAKQANRNMPLQQWRHVWPIFVALLVAGLDRRVDPDKSLDASSALGSKGARKNSGRLNERIETDRSHQKRAAIFNPH